jgi:hypothetical protein
LILLLPAIIIIIIIITGCPFPQYTAIAAAAAVMMS